MFSSEQWLANSGADFYNGVATQSVRLDDGSSASLSKTISGSPLTWTFSAWVKRSSLGGLNVICASRTAGSLAGYITFQADNKFEVELGTGNGQQTSTLFRDTSAWYHVVVNSTGANGTAKAYINSVEVLSWSPGSAPWLFTDSLDFNCSIGQYGNDQYYYDGYMSEVNFVDGLALNPTYFGETKNGAWIPKTPDVSDYGTNGFRLQFDQVGVGTASASTIGADTSGKTNHLTSSGIVASDCAMPDSPELNWCTLNPLDNGGGGANTLSEGNLKAVSSGNTWKHTRSTFTIPDGSWYCEFVATSGIGNGNTFFGIIPQDDTLPTSFIGSTSTAWAYSSNSYWYNNNSAGGRGASGSGASWATGIVIGLTFDGSTLKFYRDNSLEITIGSIPSADYAIGVALFASDAGVINFGQDPTFAGVMDSSTSAKTPSNSGAGTADSKGNGKFFYAPPSGLALCTANLPEPTIGPNSDTQADDYFNTVLYSGTGSSNAITGVGFQTDWLWIKRRNGATSHRAFDSTRANGLFLSTDTSNQEDNGSSLFTSFDSDGFTVQGTSNSTNGSSQTYVAWNWKANGGTTSSNTDGSITSTVQANTDAGFSIVTFEGNKTRGATIGHGLQVNGVATKPDMIIMKNRDLGVSWVVWFPNLQANNQLLELNSTGAVLTNTGDVNAWWNNTAPTSSLITLGDYDGINDDLSMLAYCFSSVEGYSKFGSYTGNGVTSGDGTFAFLGFRPALIMIKNTTASAEWIMVDSVRSTFNEVDDILVADNSTKEADFGTANRNIDFLSNGFKIRNTAAGGTTALNTTNSIYIYMAFADSVGAFKYATAK